MIDAAATSAFFSSEKKPLERETNVEDDGVDPVTRQQIWNERNIETCTKWIQANGFKRICLQLPDHYLPLNSISESLKKSIASDDAKIFLLADTTYGSCCVDEIAAAHIDADCVIHFGNACRSKASRIPVLYLYPHFSINLDDMLEKLSTLNIECNDKEVCIFVDIGYQQLLDDEADEKVLNDKLIDALGPGQLHIKPYPQPEEIKTSYEPSENCICIFIGSDNSRFANLSLTSKAAKWFIYDVPKNTIGEKNPLTTNYIRRRYYYIEKCKDAQTLGFIVGTLSADGYLDVVTRLQEMAKSNGVKTQIISVGRINPAKLANFMEIDCFVLIGCPFNNMYTSKEYYKPIVSVFEAEMALNPAWHMKYPDAYVTDFKELLPEGRSFLPFDSENVSTQDVSLVSGRLRNNACDDGDQSANGTSTALAPQAKMALMTSNNGLTFEDRTWQGLDPALGLTEPAKIQKGLSGIPIHYTHD